MANRVTSFYNHVQSVPSASWAVAHNLGSNGGTGVPVVDVLVDNAGTLTKIMPEQITIVDKHNVQILFTQAVAGTAIVIV